MSLLKKNCLDENDLNFVYKRYGMPIAGMACPKIGKKINPHVTRFFYRDGVIRDVFHIKPIYYETLFGKWRPLKEVTYHYGNHRVDLTENWDEKVSVGYLGWMLKRAELLRGSINIPVPSFGLVRLQEGVNIYLATLTVYPDPNPETTTVDGGITNEIAENTWAVLHDAATGTAADDSSASVSVAQITCSATSPKFLILKRGFLLWDTSALGASATISATTADLFILNTLLDESNWDPTYNIYVSTIASNTALTTADFDAIEATGQATAIAHDSLSALNYNTWTFNGTGIGNVNKTGVSKFGIRSNNYDGDNVAPTHPSALRSSDMGIACAETTDTTSDPKLTVTYTLPATAGPAQEFKRSADALIFV